MKTIVLKVDPRRPSKAKIRQAANIIKKGGLVAFPTETVYGLGADALNAKAVLSLFRAKRRPLDNPPIVHVCDAKDILKLAENIPARARGLMNDFWPGPLTLILKRSKIVPEVTVAGLNTIAIRMPNHKVALSLIRESGCPISAPSANLAGKPSPTISEHVLDDLDGRMGAILDAGPTNIGVESTVLDLTVVPPQVLRPGGISFEALKENLHDVVLNPVVTTQTALPIEKARSPGMKHRHYAPEAEVVVVEGEISAVTRKVRELALEYRRGQRRVGVLCTDETAHLYEADVIKSLGSRRDLSSVARSLFRSLRDFDAEKVDVIVAEGLPIEGLGLAVVNRLRKAAGYRIFRV